MSNKRNALGRGLGALLENAETDITTSNDLNTTVGVAGTISNIPIENIEANPFQPRTDFEIEALEELTSSIMAQGIIQPVTVRKLGYDKYQLISGERRFRASQKAGLTAIPAFVRIANDQAMLEMALVENIQRANLNPIEIAISYKRLITECNLTQEELSQRVGKNRTTVTNFLRLLKLSAEIQLAIRDGRITMSHARAIINIEDEDAQRKIFEEIISSNLSVRNAEDYARGYSTQRKRNPKEVPAMPIGKQLSIKKLSEKIEATIDIKQSTNGTGKLIITYDSGTELDRILTALNS